MKKVFFYTMAAAALTIASCQKEINDVPETEVAPSVETFTAVVDEPLTKADYTINGSSAEFSWNSNDAFYRLVRSYTVNGENRTYSSYNHYTYTASSASGYTATFTGGSLGDGYEDTGFALFPTTFANNGSEFGYVKNNNALKFILNEQLTYDADHPLKNIVPMLGTLSGTEYTFKPVVGVIGIKVQNIPSTYTSITIASSSGGMSGTTVTMTSVTDSSYKTNIGNLVGASSLGLRKEWFTAGTTKTFTFNGLNPSNTYTFYFPVPVGTYTDLSITFKEGSTIKGTVQATGLNLNVTRAKVITIPTVIDCNNVGSAIDLTDVLGTYVMKLTSAGDYSSNHEVGDIVIEASDDATKGNVMMTKFAGVSGKQYGTYDGVNITFPKAQLFGSNPYSDVAARPYVGLDFYLDGTGVVDAQFEVIEPGKIQAINCDNMGLRTCTAEEWETFGGGWPWALGFKQIVAVWKQPYAKGNEVILRTDMITPSNVCSHEGSLNGIIDDDPSTYWHSDWYQAVTNNDPTYGIYFDIELDELIDAVQFKYQVRDNRNARPLKVVLGVSDDGATWTQLGIEETTVMDNAQGGDWVELSKYDLGGNYKYFRFGIAKSGSGDLTGDLNKTYPEHTNLAELKLFWAN